MKKIEIAERILDHYRKTVNPEMSHYYGIVASVGLVGLAEADKKYISVLHDVLDPFPNSIKHVHYNFPSYKIGGNAKARAIYDGFIKDKDEEFREYANEIMTAKRSHDGIVSMPNEGGEKKIWIDVATAVTPFLLFAGLYFNEKKYIDEAVFQTLGMYDIFLDESCGLLHQSRGFCGENKISEDHWSRGNGWGIYPLSLLCEFLPSDHPEKSRCEKYFVSHMNALKNYISQSGLWRQEITVDDSRSYEEISGSGLILAAASIGVRLGLLEKDTWGEIIQNGINGMLAYVCEDGAVLNSCPGCLCPGNGSIDAYLNHRPSFKDEPHGAGPVIIALVESMKIK